MKKYVSCFATVFLFWAFIGTVNASLIGDTVTLSHNGPTLESVAYADTVVISSGDDDVVTLGSFSVNFDENSFSVNFNTKDYFSTFMFNGLVVNDLHDVNNEDYYLLNVEVKTDVAGWDDSRIIFGDDFAAFNWSGLSFNTDSEFTAMLEFGPNPIPIPTTMILFATGLIGLAMVRRKKTEN